MSAAVETPHITVLRIITGHFRETSGYRAYRARGVEDWLLIHTLCGRGRFGYGTGEIIAGPGDWMLLRPGTIHDYGVEPALRRWELLWAHFQPRDAWRPLLNWPAIHGGLMQLCVADPVESDRISRRFLDAHNFLGSNLARREAFAMNALEEVFLLCDRHNPQALAAPGDDRVRRAVEFVAHSVDRRLSLEEVAAAVGLSASRLAHLFKAETGQTLQHHIETVRMRRATELLQRTSFSVKQIAAAVGYDNPFYFSLRFKVWTRQSPTVFRRSRRGAD